MAILAMLRHGQDARGTWTPTQGADSRRDDAVGVNDIIKRQGLRTGFAIVGPSGARLYPEQGQVDEEKSQKEDCGSFQSSPP